MESRRNEQLMSINKVFISGNLTRDAEMRMTQSGMAVVSFGVAVNDRKKNSQTGEWENVPNFVDCVVYGKYGEALQKKLVKGAAVVIQGHLHYSSWERDGVKRSKLEVIADEIPEIRQPQTQGSFDAYNTGYVSTKQPNYAESNLPF